MFKRLLLTLLALLLLSLASLAIYLGRASPRHEGELSGLGLQGAVRVQRDAQGVPQLQARSTLDLAYAIGFSHAQDRGWQLELQRRTGQGRLAEAFGASALEADRFLRTLGVYRAAAAQWAWLQQGGDPEARDALRAYAQGVNAGWRSQARPPEMLLLGLKWENWTPEDSLAWALLMAWDLGTNWNQELLRLRLALALPPDTAMAQVETLLPPYPGDRYPPLANAAALYRSLGLGSSLRTALDAKLERLQAAAPGSGIEGRGSNNWAVDGARSETGQPLLANDPHLALQTPSLWYLARLQAPGLQVAGATLPGLPWVVLGQNEHIAWGFTNTGPDTQDLYLEQLRDGAKGLEVRTPSGWEPARVRVERIDLRGGGSELLEVVETRHGPLVSGAGPGQELLKTADGTRYGLALRWSALSPEQDPAAVGLAINRARSVDDYLQAVRSWHSPQQNMLVAARSPNPETEGEIAFFAPGHIPVRAPGNDLQGLFPAPGWLTQYDWQPAPIPLAALPQERAPARGWLATANHKVVGPDYPHHLTHEWATPHRQQRIEQLLQARPRHNLDSFAALQADRLSLGARALLPWLQQARSEHPLFAQVAPTLQAFDGQMSADSRAAPVYWAWVRQLTEGLFADDLGQPLYERVIASNSLRSALEAVLARNDAAWCDDRRTARAESCAEQSSAALTRALAELQHQLGREPAQWRWDQLHRLRAEHRPFSRVPLLRPLFELSGPSDGDTHTVNVSRVRLRPDWTGARYTNDHGPGLRALYDLADPTRSRVMISTGQSGLPWSRNHSDLLGPWQRVDYLPLWQAPAVRTLQLRP